MTGVEILATEEVAVEFAFCWLVFWLMLILGGGFTIVISIVAFFEGEGTSVGIPMLCVVLPIVLLVSILFGSMAEGKPTDYETHYEVTISEDVSMIEFLEKYEVLDQRGKIFVVKERVEVE